MESLGSKLHKVKRLEDHRSSLYFDQWAFSVAWEQPEIAALRFDLDRDYVEKVLERRQQWENNQWNQIHFPNNANLSYRSKITANVVENVHIVREWLANTTWPLKTVFFHGQIIVYTQCQAAADAVTELALQVTKNTVTVKQAQVTRDPDKVYFKTHSDYSHRTYFRARNLSEKTIAQLNQWTIDMGSAVKVCPSLRNFLLQDQHIRWRSTWTYDHYFVDHNDPKLEVWLAIISPGLVRKTMPIVSIAK